MQKARRGLRRGVVKGAPGSGPVLAGGAACRSSWAWQRSERSSGSQALHVEAIARFHVAIFGHVPRSGGVGQEGAAGRIERGLAN